MERPDSASATRRTPRQSTKAGEPRAGAKEPLQVRIPQDVKRRFKARAAIRGIATHELFVEMWDYYERSHP